MATINLRENQQVIDYLARDYNSFRQALLDLIPKKIPEWTDRSEADFGIALIELFAYMADILSYYQDRIANEAFLTTAQERRSVLNHLRLIGYEMASAGAATAQLSLIVGNNVTGILEIRKGDQFATSSSREKKSVTFEYTDEKPLVIDLDKTLSKTARKPDGSPLNNFKEYENIIPVREGRTIANELIGVSDGSPNQRFKLAQPRLLPDSLKIIVETTPPTPAWRLRKNLIFSSRAFTEEQLKALEQQERIGSTLAFSRSPDRDYAIETDEKDITTLIFGDGQFGKIPEVGSSIIATYRVGGGTVGNVGAGQITNITKSPQLQLLGAKVVNRAPASGGAERESIEHAIKFAPTVFSSMQRAVTVEDYINLAKLYPGVSKVRAEAGNWNVIKLYVAPAGKGEIPTDVLKQELLKYFEDKRILTTSIQIENPDYVPIVIEVKVGAVPHFRNQEVRGQVDAAIRELLDFEKVDFKETLYLSKIYEAIEDLDGVDNVFVSKFHRKDQPEQDIAKDGLIALGENEIPVLDDAELTIEVTGGV